MVRCGRDSAFALSDLLGQKTVHCTEMDRDRYDRMVARCVVGAIEINRWMVQRGHALAYRKYSTRYVEDEEIARKEGVGIWLTRFVAPWEHRAR